MVVEEVFLLIEAHPIPVKRKFTEPIPLRQGGIFQVEACILDAIHIIGLVLLGDQPHVDPPASSLERNMDVLSDSS